MTGSIETGGTPVDRTVEPGFGPSADQPTTGRATGSERGQSDAGATFDALVEEADRADRAVRRPGQAGRLVGALPTGEAAAVAWARWAPSRQALGSRPAPTAGGGVASGAGLSGSGLTGLGGLGGVAGLGRLTAGQTGVIFPRAQSVGEAVVNAAADHLGVPYLWGGTDAEKGFDCSGLIQDAYRRVGVEMPKWSRHQATMGVEVASLDDAIPGDILAFGEPVDHVGLYVGDGKMLHAPRTGDVVKVDDIKRSIVTIRRVVSPGTIGGGLHRSSGAGSGSAPTGPSGLAADLPYRDLFETAGRRHDVDPALLAAVARAESAFDPTAVSPAGAQGLMQFMPQTAAEMGVDPWEPASAVDGAARYLRDSLDRFDSVEEAIASYNAGPGAVARHGGVPPFPETQNYVRTVLNAWRG